MPSTIKKPKKHFHVLRLKRGQKFNEPMAKKIFHCLAPDCWFYAAAYNLLGKRIMCPMCLKDFICDREDLTKVKVHCKNCTRSRRAKEKLIETQSIEQRLMQILGKTI